MSITNAVERLISLRAQKRYGYSQRFGTAFFGYTRFGEDNSFAGIYQKKKTKKGWAISKEIFYWPTNPQTQPQQDWRGVFTAGKAEWDSLTAEQKNAYNKRAKIYYFTGYNLFMREYLYSHKLT